MDNDAARRARRTAIQADLREAYTDEEASPPEWVDLLTQVRTGATELRDLVAKETDRFVSEPDIRNAIKRRDRIAAEIRTRVAELNRKVGRLNLLSPHARFTRGTLNAEELLRPLFRSKRRNDVSRTPG